MEELQLSHCFSKRLRNKVLDLQLHKVTSEDKPDLVRPGHILVLQDLAQHQEPNSSKLWV